MSLSLRLPRCHTEEILAMASTIRTRIHPILVFRLQMSHTGDLEHRFPEHLYCIVPTASSWTVSYLYEEAYPRSLYRIADVETGSLTRGESFSSLDESIQFSLDRLVIRMETTLRSFVPLWNQKGRYSMSLYFQICERLLGTRECSDQHDECLFLPYSIPFFSLEESLVKYRLIHDVRNTIDVRHDNVESTDLVGTFLPHYKAILHRASTWEAIQGAIRYINRDDYQ